MVIIRFPSGAEWFKANWAFRAIVEEITSRERHDEELRTILELGGAYGLLEINALESGVAQRTVQALRLASRALLENIPGASRQASDQTGFLDALVELIELCDMHRPVQNEDSQVP